MFVALNHKPFRIYLENFVKNSVGVAQLVDKILLALFPIAHNLPSKNKKYLIKFKRRVGVLPGHSARKFLICNFPIKPLSCQAKKISSAEISQAQKFLQAFDKPLNLL